MQSEYITSSSVALNASISCVGRFDMKPTVSDKMISLLNGNSIFSSLDLKLQTACLLKGQTNWLEY